MRILLEGFDESIPIVFGRATVLEIEDRTLFARICQSFYSEMGESAIEPYVIWDDDGDKVQPNRAFLFVFNPFDLPWSDRALLGKVLDRMEDMLIADDALRQAMEGAARKLSNLMEGLSLRLQSDYAFDIEWDMRDHLKSFDFEIDADAADSLFDNLSKFLRLVEDAECEKVVCFLNLKDFLSEKELSDLYEQVFSSNVRVLLLESSHDNAEHKWEAKTRIDKVFLQL